MKSLNEFLNESNPFILNENAALGEILAQWETAMKSKSIQKQSKEQLKSVSDEQKETLLVMANEIFPEEKEDIEDTLNDLKSGEVEPELLGFKDEKSALAGFKHTLKVIDFAIDFIKKHVK